ncbi:MAG: hypothetical protein ACM3KR_03885 [Deltaproteobacteria bacterium]
MKIARAMSINITLGIPKKPATKISEPMDRKRLLNKEKLTEQELKQKMVANPDVFPSPNTGSANTIPTASSRVNLS